MTATDSRDPRAVLEDAVAALLATLRGEAIPPGEEEDEALSETERWAQGKFPPAWQAAIDAEAQRTAIEFAAAALYRDGSRYEVK